MHSYSLRFERSPLFNKILNEINTKKFINQDEINSGIFEGTKSQILDLLFELCKNVILFLDMDKRRYVPNSRINSIALEMFINTNK